MRNALSSKADTATRVGAVGLLAVAMCSLAWNQFGSVLARAWLPYAIAIALLVVFYALVFAVPILVLRGEGDRRAATSLVVAGLVTLALATFAHLLVTARPT